MLANGEKMCVNQVCDQEGLTPAFVYKILKKLEKKEIVKSFRGKQRRLCAEAVHRGADASGYLSGGRAGLLYDRMYESQEALCTQSGGLWLQGAQGIGKNTGCFAAGIVCKIYCGNYGRGSFRRKISQSRRGHVFLGKHLIFLCFTNGHALEIVL